MLKMQFSRQALVSNGDKVREMWGLFRRSVGRRLGMPRHFTKACTPLVVMQTARRMYTQHQSTVTFTLPEEKVFHRAW